ncbi:MULTISPECIES: hypothetical protein [Megasphaera]|nr:MULTISPECIES: hypothetical protein [Megasphaera]
MTSGSGIRTKLKARIFGDIVDYDICNIRPGIRVSGTDGDADTKC